MSWNILPVELATMEPLLGDIGKFKLAGIPLGEAIATRLAGLPGAGRCRSNFFPSDILLKKMSSLPGARIVHEGITLLEFGENPETFEPDPASIIVQYAWDLLKVNEILVGSLTESSIQGVVKPGVFVDGNIVVGEETVLLPGVYIEGNAVIGRGCRIGPNCYIRGNTSIGDHCHIGQAVEIKNSIIFDHSSIGHLGYLGDSVIGNHVNFGGGTVGSNLRHDNQPHKTMIQGRLVSTGLRKFGTVVGDNVHTGIQTTIYPGRKLYAHTTTRPGEIVDRDKSI